MVSLPIREWCSKAIAERAAAHHFNNCAVGPIPWPVFPPSARISGGISRALVPAATVLAITDDLG
ncbi:hypothetical protein CQ038_02225 [Arthrobacter sp. MYb51]|nr:hypothetical protein CQ038_02225 [Arthrobacter sp. MYb51]